MKRLYIPQVYGNVRVKPKPPPVKPPPPVEPPPPKPPPPGEVFPGNLSPGAMACAIAWFKLIGARSKILIPDARLIKAAQLHAEYLGQRTAEQKKNSTMHDGRNGSTPNERVYAVGYRLPDWWKRVGNNVECCAVAPSPQRAVELWRDSPKHRPTAYGEKISEWFWHRHVVWGMGESKDYYVLVVCPIEGEM